MNKKVLLIIGLVLLAFCLCIVVFLVILFSGVMTATQPSADAGEAFMTALKGGNYQMAYGLCSPALQKELGGNAAGLERLIKNGNVVPTAWTFTSRNINNGVAELTGSATFTGNRQGTARVTLTESGGAWQVIGFNLKEQ